MEEAYSDDDQEIKYSEESNDNDTKHPIVAFLIAQLEELDRVKAIKEKNYAKDQKKLFKSKNSESWKKEFHTADVLRQELTTLINTIDKEDFDYENFDLLTKIDEIETQIIGDPACSLKKNNKSKFHKPHSKLMSFMIDLKAGVDRIDRSKYMEGALSEMFPT